MIEDTLMSDDAEPIEGQQEGSDEGDLGAEGDASSAEGQVGDGSTDGEGSEPQGKQTYSPEELKHLIATDGVIDTDRLSLEGRALMKSFQSGYTSKFQAVAERERKVDEALRFVEQQRQKEMQSNVPEREKIYQRFRNDPIGVTNEINSEIVKLEATHPSDPSYPQVRRAIAQLNAAKDEFSRRYEGEKHSQRQAMDTANYLASQLRAEYPTFDAEKVQLTKFAVEQLGYSPDDVMFMTNPLTMGALANKNVLAIKRAYDRFNANTRASRKSTKPQANSTVSAGSSGGDTGRTKPSMSKLIAEAKQTGDWTKVLEAKGAL